MAPFRRSFRMKRTMRPDTDAQVAAQVMRRCSHCKMEQPLEEFGRDKTGPHGLKRASRSCCRRANANWRARFPEENRQASQRWHAKHREESRAKARDWKRRAGYA